MMAVGASWEAEGVDNAGTGDGAMRGFIVGGMR